MNIRDLINSGASKLKNISETPRLDSNILLAHTLCISKATLFANYQDEPPSAKQKQFYNYLNKREQGYPIAYILGEKEFYGYNFHIEEGILTPRPDTEILVETALKLITKDNLDSLLDMCTGTGCIALSIKKESPKTRVTATDISPIACKVFEINNKKLTDGKVKFIHSDLFSNLKDNKFDIIATNPPYLTKNETSERVENGWKEPVLALDGGDDGLDLIRTIIEKAPDFLTPGGWLIIEAASVQMTAMEKEMIKHSFHSIERLNDLAGMERIIVGKHG